MTYILFININFATQDLVVKIKSLKISIIAPTMPINSEL